MTNPKFNNNKPLRVLWKPVKEFAPYCPICSEHLSGNNSIILPYKCKCGEWQSNWNNPLEFKIKKP